MHCHTFGVAWAVNRGVLLFYKNKCKQKFKNLFKTSSEKIKLIVRSTPPEGEKDKAPSAKHVGFKVTAANMAAPLCELTRGCLSTAWRCGGLEVQRGAAADTETLQPASSNPFWTRPGTDMGPYVWESTSVLLRHAGRREGGERRDENILPAALPPPHPPTLPFAIRSVIKSSCEHKWEISKGKEGKKKFAKTENKHSEHNQRRSPQERREK